jgi:hypothetical protein
MTTSAKIKNKVMEGRKSTTYIEHISLKRSLVFTIKRKQIYIYFLQNLASRY